MLLLFLRLAQHPWSVGDLLVICFHTLLLLIGQRHSLDGQLRLPS